MYIGVYGTLKKGYFNSGFLKDSKYIKTTKLPGFLLYSFHFFPIAVPIDNKEKTIEIEIWQIDEQVYKRIRAMELGAGYREIERKVDGFLLRLWVYDRKPSNSYLIPDGIWKESEFDDVSEIIYMDPDANDFEDELVELIREYPRLLNDDEIKAYIDKYPDILKRINDNEEEIDDSWLNDKLDEFNYDDLDKSYNLSLNKDDSYDCSCVKEGLKPMWLWDNELNAFRCQKCGDIKE